MNHYLTTHIKHSLCVLAIFTLCAPSIYAVRYQSGDFEFDCNYFWGALSATLLRYMGNDSVVYIPETVVFDGNTYITRYIGDEFSRPFMDNDAVRQVYIPNSATHIGTEAFSGCRALWSIDLGSGMKAVASYAFYDCTNLSNVVMHTNVAEIGDYAFGNCTSLSRITLGKGVRRLGECVFDHAPLNAMTLLCPTSPQCDGSLSSDGSLYADCKLYVHIGSISDYLNATEWRKFYYAEEHAEVGDLNRDGYTDVGDINLIINAILNVNTDFDQEPADINQDGKIDVADLNMLINIVLGKLEILQY